MFKTRKNVIFAVGDKVTYIYRASGFDSEKGIIKEIIDNNFCFIVFNCGNDWDNYKEYTGEHCHLKSLRKGWEIT